MQEQYMLKADSLENKTILITGGGTGLGRSMAKAFLHAGARIVIASRKQDVLEKTAAELAAETGGVVDIFPCDVRDYTAVEACIRYCIARSGHLDALVNNAAGNFISPTERLSSHAFDTIVDIVLRGTYNCTLAAGKYWIKEKLEGTVLSIVTTYAFTGSGYVVPSACAKAGVLAMTRSLAAEWGKYGIRLNAIAPGPFPTEGAWSRLIPKGMDDAFDLAKRNALGRLGRHEELCNLAAYLISAYSAFITGEVVVIDGGEWIQGAGEFNMLGQVPDAVWDQMEKMRKGAGNAPENK